MPDDIEQHLAAAAGALREHELATRRAADLRDRMDDLRGQIDVLRDQHAGERRDVERLEGLSLTRVLASLRGARDDALARERAEADAARYRVTEAEARYDALCREYDAAKARRDQLATAPDAYAAALEQKERHLGASGDPRGVRLLELAEERGRLAAELREVREALAAASGAARALGPVEERLRSASGWSTYDTFFGGGAFSSAIKHSRLDDAAEAAARADRQLAVLRTELADVPGVPQLAPRLAVDGMTRFADIWFDNIFTDLAVRDRVKQAQRNVARSIKLVDDLAGRLEERAAYVGARLGAIETERQLLLTGGR